MNFYASSPSETVVDESHTHQFNVGSGGLFIHGRMGAAATTGLWLTVNGSPYLTRVGNAHDLAPGCGVSGAGIPAGAYLKRAFSDSLIEISAPATADSADATAGTAVSFAAYNPVTVQHVEDISMIGSSSYLTLAYTKHREEDDFRAYIDWISDTTEMSLLVTTDDAAQFSLATNKTTYPATVFFRDVRAVVHNPIYLTKADVMFRPRTAGSTNAYVNAVTLDGTAKISVSNGLSTTLGDIAVFSGSMKKAGGGLLTAYTKLSSLGTINVAEGEFALVPTGGVATVSSLSVASGATFSLATGTLTVSAASLSAGATLRVGAGASLVLPKNTNLSGIAVECDGSIGFDYGLKAGDYGRPMLYASQRDCAMKGNPAFWVTAESLTNTVPSGTVELENGTNFVSRWNDVRGGADAGYHFATNFDLKPFIATNSAGMPYVKILKSKSPGYKAMVPGTTSGFIWDTPITTIRTVFAVIDVTDGYSSILGSSRRLSTTDFVRGSTAINSYLFYIPAAAPTGYASPNVGGPTVPIYCNGKEMSNGPLNSTGVTVIEVDPLANVSADAFGIVDAKNVKNRWDLCGSERVHEYIIYTNALTFAERWSVHEYLLKKYKSAAQLHSIGPVVDKRSRIDAIYPRSGVETETVNVEAESSVGVVAVTNGASIRKSGGGTMYLADLSNESGALEVEAGDVVVNSCDVSALSIAPNAYIHLDANASATLTTKHDNVRDLEVVTDWADPDSGRTATAQYRTTSTNLPFIVDNALNGLKVIDFGKAFADAGGVKAYLSPCLLFPISRNLRTVFTVLGSAGGGCTVLGGTSGRNDSLSSRIGANTSLGLWRDVQSFPGRIDMPLIYTSGYGNSGNYISEFQDPAKTVFKVNGAVVNQKTTFFSGGYDLISIDAKTENMESSVLAGIHYAHQFGGQSLGEIAYYERRLDNEEFTDTEAILMKKWFNRTTPLRRAASVGTLKVAPGASVTVEGGAPLTVGSFSGGGSVSGAVTFLADADWTFEAKSDGTIAPLSVTGALDISAGGTVHVTGDTGALNAGMYTLMTATSISAGELGAPVIAPHVRHRGYSYTLVSDATSVSLKVTAPGMVIKVE